MVRELGGVPLRSAGRSRAAAICAGRRYVPRPSSRVRQVFGRFLLNRDKLFSIAVQIDWRYGSRLLWCTRPE